MFDDRQQQDRRRGDRCTDRKMFGIDGALDGMEGKQAETVR